MFKPKCRENVNQKDLPRVLFLFHPETKDYVEVMDRLLKVGNVLFLYQEEVSSINDIQLAVNTINLCLLYVDDLFLEKKDKTILENIKLLSERHIRYVPLVASERLLDEFTNVFGEIQYISLELPEERFEKKIKDVFDTFLFKEELAQEIRNNFTSKIFLSYRHKDIKDAYRVMTAIHHDERNYNVGIWYDDYLTSGEDFNNEIEREINNANGFVLTTTPNLVNEDNYVRKIEYKIAHKAENVQIVSIETSETDKDLLKEQYQDIPDSISIEDQKQIDDVMAKLFNGKVVDDPKTKGLLGVAYLKGIYVEKDFAKAIKLLNEGLDGGDVYSGFQLEQIYENGIETEPDIEKAIYYQRILVDLVIKYGTDKLTVAKYKFYLARLLFNSFSDSHEIEQIALENINIYKEQDNPNLEWLSLNYSLLLTYYVRLHDDAYLEKAAPIVKQIEGFLDQLIKLNDYSLLEDVANIIHRLALYYYSCRDYKRANEHYFASADLYKKLLDNKYKDADYHYVFVVVSMGSALKHGAPKEILPYLEDALKVYETMVRYRKEDDELKLLKAKLIVGLAISHSHIGDADIHPYEQQLNDIFDSLVYKDHIDVVNSRLSVQFDYLDALHRVNKYDEGLGPKFQNLADEIKAFIDLLDKENKTSPYLYYNYCYCLFNVAEYTFDKKSNEDNKERKVIAILDYIKQVNDENIKADIYKISRSFGEFQFYGLYLICYLNLEDYENANKVFDILLKTEFPEDPWKGYGRLINAVYDMAVASCLLDRSDDFEKFINNLIEAYGEDSNCPIKIYEMIVYAYFKIDKYESLFKYTVQFTRQLVHYIYESDVDRDIKLDYMGLLNGLSEAHKDRGYIDESIYVTVSVSGLFTILMQEDAQLAMSNFAFDYMKGLVYALPRLVGDEKRQTLFDNAMQVLFYISYTAYHTYQPGTLPVEYGASYLILGSLAQTNSQFDWMVNEVYKMYTDLLAKYPPYLESIFNLLDILDYEDIDKSGELVLLILDDYQRVLGDRGINFIYLFRDVAKQLEAEEHYLLAIHSFNRAIKLINDDIYKMEIKDSLPIVKDIYTHLIPLYEKIGDFETMKECQADYDELFKG